MVKAGITRITDWTSLLLGRTAAVSDSHRRYTRIVQGLVSAIAGRGMGVIVSLISIPLTVGYLGSERYGVWMCLSTLLAWLSLSDIGLGNSLTNALSESYATDRRDQAQVYVASVFWSLCAAGLALGGIAALVWRWVDWVSLMNVKSTIAMREIGPAFAVALAVFILNFPLSIVPRILSAYQESPLANFWAAGANLASLGGLLIATRLQWSLPALVGAFSLSSLFVSAVSAVWLFNFHMPWLKPSVSTVEAASVKKLSHVGGMFFVAQIAGLLVMQTHNLIIAHYLGAGAVTPFSVSWRLFGFSTLIQMLLLQSLWPAYAEAFARGDGTWIKRTFRLNLITSIALTTVIVVPLVFFGLPIIRHWAGAEALPSFNLLILMAIWSLLSGIIQPVICMLNGLGRVKVQMTYGILTAAVNVVLCIILVQRLGVEGVILGTILAYITCALLPLWLETKSTLSSLPN